MSKNLNRNLKKNDAKPKKKTFPWQQLLFAGFALMIVLSMILSAFM